ncbi:hypothetical protein NA56DRAFT_711215 [Hyaloscypha hepaticicola]|uniref:Uncharacterized protein n=1 Tax=Hyaloscypha hepaticicola TaxID=2082293 RepID=A0A2J6PJA8_9HELO|nr:hypothetical protein NA56DRAFT_711215 [Hyaloscypha hepaticicola]
MLVFEHPARMDEKQPDSKGVEERLPSTYLDKVIIRRKQHSTQPAMKLNLSSEASIDIIPTPPDPNAYAIEFLNIWCMENDISICAEYLLPAFHAIFNMDIKELLQDGHETPRTWACRKKLITACDFQRAIDRHEPQNIDIKEAARRVTNHICVRHQRLSFSHLPGPNSTMITRFRIVSKYQNV